MNEVTVLAPATVANVVCGFDVMGFALETPHDLMTVRKTAERTVRIVHRDDFDLPTDPRKNIAGVTLLAMLEQVDENIGFEVEITKNIRPGSGIGSSAASASGAAVAANLLLGKRFSRLQLVEFAMRGELLASGAKHADNVAPGVFGGFTLVRSSDPLDVIKLDYPEMWVTVVHPQIEIKTFDARRILPERIALKTAIKQWGNVAGLTAGLLQKDYDLIQRSLEDHIVEPVRTRLIPQLDQLKTFSKQNGALGGGISGSGPSIFMFSRNRETAQNVEAAMQRAYESTNIEFQTYVTTINPLGVREIQCNR